MLKGDRATPSSYLVGSKDHETVKIFYADANARITQNRGFDGRTILHGEIGRTNSDVQKRDGQTNKHTDKQAKKLNVFGHPSGG